MWCVWMHPLEVGEVNRAKGEDCVLGGKGHQCVRCAGTALGCRSVALGFVASGDRRMSWNAVLLHRA